MTRPGQPPPLLRVLARLVPRERRDAWLREWSAEAAHADAAGPERGRTAVALAALEDAAGLRFRSQASGGATTDLRYALRSLLRRPGFAAVVVLTLGLGLGATVSIASAVRGVLLRPLPWDEPERIVRVATAFHGPFEAPFFAASVPEYLDLRAEHPGFGALAAYTPTRSNLGGATEPRRVGLVQGTPGLLSVLGVEPTRGRAFGEEDGRPGAADVALLTHGLWTDAFGADPGVVGSTVRIDEIPHTVVGVLGPDFEFPGMEVDVLTALRLDTADPTSPSSHWIYMLGRLRPGTDVEEARAMATDLVARWEARYADRHAPDREVHPLVLEDVREVAVGDMGRPLLVLTGAVLLVLLVACLNVANLLLVRGEDRTRELGVRTALGAGRGRLIRQLLVEAGVLVGAGGVLGLALAVGAMRVLPVLAGGSLPPNAAPTVDAPVLAFAALLVVGVTLVFGLLPAFADQGDVAGALREDGGRATADRGRLAFRRALVVAEVAAAVALIAGAGVLARGFANLVAVDPGIEADGALLFDVELPRASYGTAAEAAAFHRELKERAEALPDVRSVGTLRSAPLSGDQVWESVSLPGEPPPSEDEAHGMNVLHQVADPGLFEALGLAVLAGRAIEPGDDDHAPLVAVVNQTAARSLWGDRDPLGREVRLGPPPPAGPNPAFTVVGVVTDNRQTALDQDPPPQLFMPRAQAGAVYGGLAAGIATVVVRTDGPPRAVLPALRAIVRELDPLLPLADVRTLREQVARSVGQRRFITVLMGLFSTVAAVLGAVGLYGLVAYVVTRKSREIGIRYALGAARGRVVGGIVAEAGGLVVLGALLGVGVAWTAGRTLEGLVFGVSPRDPLMLAAAPLLLVAVGLVAAWLPARRASSVDPAVVLREG